MNEIEFSEEWQKLRDKLAEKKKKTIREQLKLMKEKYEKKKKEDPIRTFKENIGRKSLIIKQMKKNKDFNKIFLTKGTTIYRLIICLIAEGLTNDIIKDLLLFEFSNKKIEKGKRRTVDSIMKDIFNSVE
jgi:hypothetical protein